MYRIGLISLALALLAADGIARADVVVLKNGTRYDGRILRSTPSEITIHSEGIDWTFTRDKIESIKKDKLTAKEAEEEEREAALHFAETVAPVTMYSTSWCSVCKHARNFFREQRINFVDKNIELDHDAKVEMRRKCSGLHLQCRGVPVIDVRGNIVEGFNPDSVRWGLEHPATAPKKR